MSINPTISNSHFILEEKIKPNADNDYGMIDSTIVRAHQYSAGAIKKIKMEIRPSGEVGLKSILVENRFNLFEKICSNFEPLDMQALLSSHKSPRLIHKNLKANNEISYDALMKRVFSNSFGNKSIKELSVAIINFCEKGEFSNLKTQIEQFVQ